MASPLPPSPCVCRAQRSTDGGATFTAINVQYFAIIVGYQNTDCDYGGIRMLREDPTTVFWFGYQTLYDPFPPVGMTYQWNLCRTQDSGANWSNRLPTGAAATDVITSLRSSALTSGLIWAYNRNDDELYKDDAADAVANWSILDAAMDFDLGDFFPTIDDDNEFRIGNLITGATLYEQTSNEGLAWSDHTGDLAPPETSDGIARVLIPRQI